MKIQIFSDLHGESVNIDNSADVLFSLGDNSGSFMLDLNYEAKYRPVIAVLGNHDSNDYKEHYQRIMFLDFSAVKVGNLIIGGVPGCVTDQNNDGSQIAYSYDEYTKEIKTLKKCDIILSHTIPDIIKSSAPDIYYYGIPALSEYINTQNPRFVFCGHIHQNRRFVIGNTIVETIYKSRIIEL